MARSDYWIRQCDAGDGDLCWLLGEDYARGGTNEWGYFPQSDEHAAQFFAKGCKLDSVKACGGLGHALLKGAGVKPDAEMGAKLIVFACEKGDKFACGEAGIVLYGGRGIERSPASAQRAECGCTQGSPGACQLQRNLFGTEAPSEGEPPGGSIARAMFLSLPERSALNEARTRPRFLEF
jgi:TPR repeat protein